MSEKSAAEKLLIKANAAVWASDPARLGLVGQLPEGARQVEGLDQATVALVFVDDAASLRRLLDEQKGELARSSVFWVAYPKANRADVNRDSLWPILAEYGMRPITQVALDEVWSALRFRPYREGEAPFTGGRR